MSAFGADMAPKFPRGRILLTQAARSVLSDEDINFALLRHHCGDWGELDPGDRRRNESALVEGERLLSVYRSSKNIRFYVITEADRKVTTILLPSDY
jgi:hypothetical protein